MVVWVVGGVWWVACGGWREVGVVVRGIINRDGN